MHAIEALVRYYSTRPVNGQRLRLYTTRMEHPENARIGLVGFNQTTGFPADTVSPDEYVRAMMNGPYGRALYERVRGDRGPSRARKNIDRVSERLGDDVLEFNVICYATPMSRDLTQAKNPGGRDAGRQAGLDVLAATRLPVLVVHGSGASKELGRMLEVRLPSAASKLDDGISCCGFQTQLQRPRYEPLVFAIPSLAPPASDRRQKWEEQRIDEVVEAVRSSIGSGTSAG